MRFWMLNRTSFALYILMSLPVSASAGSVRHRAVAHPPFVPRVGHVFMVVLENADEDLTEELPFFKELRKSGVLLENYHALAHPSQPNYIALAAGSSYGVTDDNSVTVDASHLGDLLENRQFGWKVYAEEYPGNCFLGPNAGNPATGQYERRHVPFINFKNVQDDPVRCNIHIVNASELDADVAAGTLSNFSFYVPNGHHNGHDTDPATADAWLQSRLGPLLTDPRFMNDMVVMITWDESVSATTQNAVATLLLGDSVRPGAESMNWYDHYNLLRTIEDLFGVGTLLKHDATAAPITGIWK
jgi:phosphoesterase family protein